MPTTGFITKYLVVQFLADGRVKLGSDGWVACGEYSHAEVQALFQDLSNQGWLLVSSLENHHTHKQGDRMDLFFRKAGESIPG